MDVVIVGAGLTGLVAAYELQKKGHSVSIFEKEKIPGGLAMGFTKSDWIWPLEKHYHHIFESDTDIRELAAELGVSFNFSRPNTSTLIDGGILQLDSPIKLLLFPKLNILQRLRMAFVLGYLKYFASWKNLEKHTAHKWLQKYMGKKAYEMIWRPLLIGKFGQYYKEISLSWFWARIKARTTKLGYPEGGFQNFANTIAQRIQKSNGSIQYLSNVSEIGEGYVVVNNKRINADMIIVTLPNSLFAKLTPKLPIDYKQKLNSFISLGAVNLVLEMDAPLLKDKVYWLSICDESYPFLAIVEHTNYINKKYYGGKNIIYVGNYLPNNHRYFDLTADQIFLEFDSYLKKLNPDYLKNIISKNIFKAQNAQPVVTVNFSKIILPFKTPIQNIYLANMQQVYPWDRGTNFAVQLGKQVADYICTSNV